MATFALIAEGITDQAVLESVIETWCGQSLGDDIDVNYLQPARDATDSARAASFGGWERVLEYCTFAEHVDQALQINDYLVIHIDTDTCEHERYGICLTDGGVERVVSAVVSDVCDLLASKLGCKIIEANRGRIIFAVSVHSIECWLLPLFASEQVDKSRRLNCSNHLRRVLGKNGIEISKDYDSYSKISRIFGKQKDVAKAASHNESLKIFIDSLP